jgi:choline-sulfatase
MLGERGMWFKMSFLEHSARIPLIVHWPKQFAPRRIKSPVSLVDLLPTLTDLASGGKSSDFVTPMDGHSLFPYLNGSTGSGDVVGEYFAEGTDTPIFMIRRGALKAIYSEKDGLQLFDLEKDPDETINYANDPDYKNQADALVSEIKNRYDIPSLTERVLESQRRRSFLKNVMRQQNLSWDYHPVSNAEKSYVRNSMPIYELERRSRFPSI